MGLCASDEYQGTKEEQERNDRVTKMLKQQNQQKEKENIHKLLLLGAGQSGKSTLFKQMKIIYGKKISKEELDSYKPTIVSNVIASMKTLVEYAEKFAKVEDSKTYTIQDTKAAAAVNAANRETLDEALGKAIENLWKDSAIQETYKNRHKFQLIDSAEYYFKKVADISNPDWSPCTDDVLRSRARTTGIVETDFKINGSNFQMFDVGGQKSERKKWVSCFDDVEVILFVAAISGFNLTLFEDMETNRITEALGLFEHVAHMDELKGASLILFLNKRDLFQEKIKTFDITMSPNLSSFKGDCRSFEETSEFIQSKFLELAPVTKSVVTRVTCATDRENVTAIFSMVKQHCLNVSMHNAGLTNMI